MTAMLANVAIGFFLVLAPRFFHSPVMTPSHLTAARFDAALAPLLIAFSVMAIWDVMHSLRWACVLIGFCLLITPLFLGGRDHSSIWVTHLISGLLIIALSLIGRKHRHQYNGGWASVFSRTKTDLGKITWS